MRYMKNVGDCGEEFAARMLETQGFRVIERNYMTGYGEIDIIASRDGILHFIEVKTRTSDKYGFPSDSITEEKRKRMRRAAECYLSRRRAFWRETSVDVFEIMIGLIENCI